MYKSDGRIITEEDWRQYKATHDIKLRNEILMAYIHIVTYNARRMSEIHKNYSQTEDIINHGVIALMDCIDKFDYTRGVQFDSFASIRVRGSIIDYIRKQDWIPRKIRKKSKDISNAYIELQNVLGRQATDAEVAEHLGMDVEELNKTIGEVHSAAIFYFEDMLQEIACEECSGPRDMMPEQRFQETELKEVIANSIDSLSEKERMIVSLYYFDSLKLKEIALVMGITASRVSQLHSKALIKLQHILCDYIKN